MTFADLVVVEVVRRRDLDAAAAELRVYIVVGDDGDPASDDRQYDLLSDEFRVTLVVGMYRNRRVAQHRLGASGGDDDMAVPRGQRIPKVPQMAGFVLRQHFEIGQRGV